MGSTREASDMENAVGNTGGVPDKKGIPARIKEICDPKGQFHQIWNKIFVTSCVLAVSLDPLFFYILIIDQDNKCLQMDEVLRNVAIALRLLTDTIVLVHFIYDICDGVKTQRENKKLAKCDTQNNEHSESGLKSKIRELTEDAQKIGQKMSWLSVSIIIDFLALLPMPQLLIVVTFYKMKSSGYVEHKKVLHIFLLGQYLPKIYQIHLSSKELKKTNGMWIKGLFNFFLYILASHVLGAFWYYFSILRETSCWYQACVNYSKDPTGCTNAFYCDRTTTSRNITFLNEHCPLDSPDGAPPFSFGIFLDSLKNQNTEQIKFGKKFFYSFWWGLRNLSNFGTNLTTSTYVWENLFAILLSVIGLLLFLYLIGTVQTFVQMEAKKSEEIRLKIKRKKLDISEWISRNKLPEDMEKDIINSLNRKSREYKNAALQNDLFSILPVETSNSLRRCLCMKAFTNNPKLEKMDTTVLEKMCDYMKPVTYNENSFVFRMGDPLDCMLVIIEGTIWTYSTNGASPAMTATAKPLGKGEIYGEELLNGVSPDLIIVPISTQHVKSQTKVEAFALMASDMATVFSYCQQNRDSYKCNDGHPSYSSDSATTHQIQNSSTTAIN